MSAGPSSRARSARGQGTVELALCSIVFVTVLLFGIHFAEVGYLSLKVQEAAAFAVWDATGRRVQDIENRNTLPMAQILTGGTSAERLAEDRYRDFSSLTTGDTAQPVTKALTRGDGFDVECSEDPQLSNRFVPSPRVRAANVYHARGGFQCEAKARLTSIRIPDFFIEGPSGFFGERHEVPRNIWVCAVGRATGTSCRGKLSLLLNDWGMAGDDRGINNDCKLMGCQNRIYRDAVRALFPGGGGAGAAFATAIAGGAPTNANEFWFSFAGEESNYMDGIGGEGPPEYNTGSPGIGLIPQARVGRCFLGHAPPGGLVPGC
jgi:hypothetical protein